MKYFILTLFIFSLKSLGVDVISWQQDELSPRVLLPKKDGQSNTEAVKDYILKIEKTRGLDNLINREDLDGIRKDGKLPYKIGISSNIDYLGPKVRFVVVVNELREVFSPPAGRRIHNITKRLEANGAEVFVLPVMHDLTLNAKESKEYRKLLANKFDAQFVLGGDDIDPLLYGEKQTYAKALIRKRDVSELKFVRNFLENSEGATFALCRGHQMCAVALRKKLIQDIQIENGADDEHLMGQHPINLTKNTPLYNEFKSNQISVNSIHHQAVDVSEDDVDYKIMATSHDDDPVVEALEFKNGKGFTLQFHPELMFDEIGDRVMKLFVDYAKKRMESKATCFKLLDRNFNSKK